ncbi:hypothetical protein BGZ63DRAFT_418544 [Mariannaea sp. PMI_226]|nr:hypothetical protein BGZ63DRAFT_418544 [Mariannaea sp. PMI_226]
MSDDATPTSPARIDVSGNRVVWGDGVSVQPSPSSRLRAQSQSQQQRRKKKKKSRRRRNPGLSKKLEFVTHLLKSLDTLVFAELSALYYMECSMFRFILRAIGQYMYLTPKDESFPFLMPASRTHVVLILFPNLLCMLLHLFCSLPVGPDYHRGYMQGGMIIDFVGQKPPASRLYYILADFAILAVQSLMLTIHSERERLRLMLRTFRPLVSEAAREITAIPSIEDLDAEERGVSNDMSASITMAEDEANDIELQPLRRTSDADEGNEQNADSESVSRDSLTEESSRSHLSDLLSSGNAILGEYHVLHSIRTAAMDLERTAANSLRSISYGATLAAIEARRRGPNVTNRAVQNDRQ